MTASLNISLGCTLNIHRFSQRRAPLTSFAQNPTTPNKAMDKNNICVEKRCQNDMPAKKAASANTDPAATLITCLPTSRKGSLMKLRLSLSKASHATEDE